MSDELRLASEMQSVSACVVEQGAGTLVGGAGEGVWGKGLEELASSVLGGQTRDTSGCKGSGRLPRRRAEPSPSQASLQHRAVCT